MSYSLAGSTITQTGFDSSLAGLSGISGVTVSGETNGKKHYLLTGRQLVLNGAQIIDPEVECLEFDSTSAVPNLVYNSKFQIGRKRGSSSEISTITATAATGLGGTYFTFHDGVTQFYVWFTVDGSGANPNPGGTGILCALLGTDTNAQVATKIQAAIMSRATFPLALVDVSVSSATFVISNNGCLVATASNAGTSGFTVVRTRTGDTTGKTRYSDGDALIFCRQGSDWAGGLNPSQSAIIPSVANTVFIGYGGRINTGLAVILCGGPLSSNSLTGHVIIEKLHFFSKLTPTGQACQLRFQHLAGSTVNVSGLTLDCDASIGEDQPGVIGFRSVAPTFFSGIFKSFQMQNLNTLTPPAGDFTFDDIVFANNFRKYDVIGNYGTTYGVAVPVWTFRNTDVGTATRIFTNVSSIVGSGTLNCLWTEIVNANLRDASNAPITSNAKIWLTETNDGSRFEAVGRTGFNWLTVQTYTQTVDGTGKASTTVRLGIGYVARDAGPVNTLRRSYFGKTSADDFDIYAIGYLYNIAKGSHILRGVAGYSYTQPMVTDLSITQTNKTTVDAYATIDTAAQFYDRAKSYLYDNYAGQNSTIVTRTGTLIDAGSYNIVVDASAAQAFAFNGTTITIKSSTFIGSLKTTGTITLQNGAVVQGARIDNTGTITYATLDISNIVSGSRLLIRRTDTQAVLVNTSIAGTTYQYVYYHTTNLPVEVVLRKATSAPFYQEWKTSTTLAATSSSLTANQLTDE